MCDLYTGECVAMNNRSLPPEDNGEIVPGVPGTDEKGKGVEVSLQFASSMVGICFFGFLLTISSAVQYGKVVAFRREHRRQQQELEARELLVAAGDEADAADGADPQGNADGDDEEDEAKLCKVCFCNKVDCALLKCGHIVCCRWCAKKLALCPICREPVSKLVRLTHVDGIRKALGEGDNITQTPTTEAPASPQPPQQGASSSMQQTTTPVAHDLTVVEVAPAVSSVDDRSLLDAPADATSEPIQLLAGDSTTAADTVNIAHNEIGEDDQPMTTATAIVVVASESSESS